MPTRRRFLAQCGALAVTWGCGSKPRPRSPAAPRPVPGETAAPPTGDPDDDALEAALASIATYGPEFGDGSTNHAPMVVEALAALGRAEAAKAWLQGYRDQLEPRPAGSPIANAPRALGQSRALGDWIATFRAALTEAPWQDVLAHWVPALAPGMSGVAAHGVIRAGHAARALDARTTPVRLALLADGLGAWAARYAPLPGKLTDAAPQRSVSRAMGQIPLLPAAERQTGRIVPRLEALSRVPAFADVIDMTQPGPDVGAFVADIADTIAAAYLRYGADHTTAWIHALTGPAATRLLLPHVRKSDAATVARYAWQLAAGLYAAFAPAPWRPLPPIAAAKRYLQDLADLERIEGLIDRAVATGDAHAIKLTEACLREWHITPRPQLLAAAYDATERLAPGHSEPSSTTDSTELNASESHDL